MTNVAAIVQARMGSTRLPGKVMMDILGMPMLTREIKRIELSKKVNSIVVATTTLPADDVIVEMCTKFGFTVFRGHEIDVLDRYYQCAKAFDADVIVRLTGDCPLIDPEIIDAAISKFFEEYPYTDYTSNVLPVRTFPRGLDVEVMSFAALERSWWRETYMELREHVTKYILRSPDKFKISTIVNDVNLSGMRWTVDTIEDFRLIYAIYSHFADGFFSWRDALDLVTSRPELQEINCHIQQKEIFTP